MSRPLVFGVFTAFSIILLSCLISWLSGYNFDHRGLGVAFWVGATLIFSLLFGVIVKFETKSH